MKGIKIAFLLFVICLTSLQFTTGSLLDPKLTLKDNVKYNSLQRRVVNLHNRLLKEKTNKIEKENVNTTLQKRFLNLQNRWKKVVLYTMINIAETESTKRKIALHKSIWLHKILTYLTKKELSRMASVSKFFHEIGESNMIKMVLKIRSDEICTEFKPLEVKYDTWNNSVNTQYDLQVDTFQSLRDYASDNTSNTVTNNFAFYLMEDEIQDGIYLSFVNERRDFSSEVNRLVILLEGDDCNIGVFEGPFEDNKNFSGRRVLRKNIKIIFDLVKNCIKIWDVTENDVLVVDDVDDLRAILLNPTVFSRTIRRHGGKDVEYYLYEKNAKYIEKK